MTLKNFELPLDKESGFSSELFSGEPETYVSTVTLPEDQKEMVRALFKVMRAKGVVAIDVSFSGAGDSGQFDDYSWTGLHQEVEDVSLETMTFDPATVYEPAGQAYNTQTNKWENQYNELQVSNLKDLADAVSLNIVALSPVDWWNNDGGRGVIRFYIDNEDKENILIDMKARVESYEDHPMVVEIDG